MNKLLITGATGTIGRAVVKSLLAIAGDSHIIMAARKVASAEKSFEKYPKVAVRWFDFETPASFKQAFKDINVLFLLRPPHISDIPTYFTPLFAAAKAQGIQKIVFLSVQGAEKSKRIPHHKIELLIKQYGFNYIFIRPSYFMQNLTTSLLSEIQKKHCISLPSASAKFNWIDAEDIGTVAALFLIGFDGYQNKEYEIMGLENKGFSEVAALLTQILEINIQYHSLNPIRFYFKKKKEGLSHGFALVMTILHVLPRLQKEPQINQTFRQLTGKDPGSLKDFILRERELFLSNKTQ